MTESGKPQSSPRLTDMVAVSEQLTFAQAFPPASQIKFLVLAGLFCLLNYRQFPILVDAWIADPNMSHGFIIPLFSLYLLYARREELFRARRTSSLWGLPFILLGIAMLVFGTYPIGNALTIHCSMLVLMFGLVLYLAGWQVIRLTWLPIFYLFFAIPIPPMLYTRVAVPLQELAAACSAALLQLCNVHIEVVASHLSIQSFSGKMHQLTVAEACSGVRSMTAFLALGVAFAYLADRPVWQRIVLVLATVPVTILCNILRVTGTATMFVLDKPELGQKFMHEFMGMVMLVPATLLLWLLAKLLDSLFVEVDEEEETPSEHTEGGTAK
jgi:exosortase